MARQSRTGRASEAGFTMAELLVVLLIVGLLAAIAVPNVAGSIARARETALRENLFVMRKSLDDYFADKAAYPPSLDALVEERYLRFVPEDPVAPDGAGWRLEQNEAGRITDIHSTSNARGTDDTPYSDW